MPETPSPSREDRARLDELFAQLRDATEHFVGYPCNCDFVDFRELHRFLQFPINNVGDPFGPGLLKINTRALEREVLGWFAHLFHAPAGQWWGYVNNGGTEGNMYGLYLAREILPDGIVYFSEETHYSVSKIMSVLRMRHIMIRSQPSGEMDYADLRESLRIHRDNPPIIFANIGTTMKEGLDDIAQIRRIIKEFAIPRSYVHADAALAGMTLPFIEGAPVFDFRAGVDSLAMSGHKFIGLPLPAGVVLAKKQNVERISRSIEYVGALDTTLSGSRNAFTPLLLWYALRARGMDGFRRQVRHCREIADYAVVRFNEAGLRAWKNPHAVTVVIPRPPAAVLERWSLAVQEDYGHIICMPHLTRAKIDELVEDILAAQAEARGRSAARAVEELAEV